MNLQTTVLGTLAYTLVTFPLAVTWHVVLFREQYLAFGYFEKEPDLQLGLLTILLQGLVLSFLYPFVKFRGRYLKRGLKFSLCIGAFFWTSHVLAFVIKQAVENAGLFIVMETGYLFVQFGLYGLLIGMIYEKFSTKTKRRTRTK